MGACTVVIKKQGVSVDGKRTVEALVNLSSSYATNGDTVDAAALGLARVQGVEFLASPTVAIPTGGGFPAAGTGGHEIRLAGTETAPKLTAYVAAGTEAVNATNLSTKQFAVRFIGYA